ncbi:MAG: PDZ domain-containing protein, partial [Thiobacillaceae bacterium]
GVSAQELTVDLAQAYGLEAPRGALVTEVRPMGPADRAGLQPGDIILDLNDIAIADSADLPPIIGASQPGTELLLTVLRDGQLLKLKPKVGELGQEGTSGKRATTITRIERLKLKVSDLDAATRQVLSLHGGVMVEDIEAGPATIAGIQPGDILLKLGPFQVDNAARLRDLTNRLPADRPFPLLVRRQDSYTFVTISLPKAD